MARRFDLGRALLAVGALVLLSSLFVDWYDIGQNAWEVFEALDLVLAGLALAALWAAARGDDVDDWVGPALAGAALFIVVVQLLDAPPAAGNADPSTGAWLALAASLAMVAGAVLSLVRFGIMVEMREHDRRRRVAAVDRRNEPAEPRSAGDELGRTESFAALREDDDTTAGP